MKETALQSANLARNRRIAIIIRIFVPAIIRQFRHRIDSLAQGAPECIRIRRTGEAARKTDDGDWLSTVALDGVKSGLERVNRLQGFQQYSLPLAVLARDHVGILSPHRWLINGLTQIAIELRRGVVRQSPKSYNFYLLP
jgi:hypothetical protein